MLKRIIPIILLANHITLIKLHFVLTLALQVKQNKFQITKYCILGCLKCFLVRDFQLLLFHKVVFVMENVSRWFLKVAFSAVGASTFNSPSVLFNKSHTYPICSPHAIV